MEEFCITKECCSKPKEQRTLSNDKRIASVLVRRSEVNINECTIHLVALTKLTDYLTEKIFKFRCIFT